MKTQLIALYQGYCAANPGAIPYAPEEGDSIRATIARESLRFRAQLRLRASTTPPLTKRERRDLLEQAAAIRLLVRRAIAYDVGSSHMLTEQVDRLLAGDAPPWFEDGFVNHYGAEWNVPSPKQPLVEGPHVARRGASFKVRFLCQVWEWSSADGESGPETKRGRFMPSGGRYFTLEVSDIFAIYREGEIIRWFEDVFLPRNYPANGWTKVTYLDHEVITDPEEVVTAEFNTSFNPA